MAYVNYKNKNYKQAQLELQICLDNLLTNKIEGIKLYQFYTDMIKFYLQTNLDKAIILGKALLSEEEIDNIPFSLQNNISFLIGTAYILNQNFEDGQNKLKNIILESGNDELKGLCFNNLALATFIDENQKLNLDNIPHLLFKSLYHLEDIIQADEKKQKEFENFKKNLIDGNSDLFTKTESAKVILNIVDYYIKENKINKLDLIPLLGVALKIPGIENTQDFFKILYTMGIIFGENEQFLKAEGLLRNAKQGLENSFTYGEVECLFYYSNILKKIGNREKEAEEVNEKAKYIYTKLAPWEKYKSNMFVPEFHL